MEELQQFDAGIFTALNGLHGLYFDSFMYLVTKIATWTPMILMLLYLLFLKKGWRKAVAVVLAVGLVILIADQVSATIIKPLVARARPSTTPTLPLPFTLSTATVEGLLALSRAMPPTASASPC